MKAHLMFYGRLMMRRAPIMLALFLLCSIAGYLIALRVPTTFTTSARLLLQAQEISSDLAASTVQITALEELRLLQTQVTRRAILIDVAHEYDVFENINQMSPDLVVSRMNDALLIEVSGGPSRARGPQPALMEISFTARTGQIAADVVNEMITLIETESVTIRQGSADQTLAFFERQVENLAADLEESSADIAEYQAANADALPEDQPFRLQRQAVLQQLLTSSERELRSLAESRTRTIEIFNASNGTVTGAPQSPLEIELEQRRAELRRALINFSETNPQVVQLQRQIAQLEDELANQVVLPETTDTPQQEGLSPILRIQLADIDSRIEELEGEMADAQAELSELEGAINRSPAVGVQLNRLQRSYDLIQLQYDNMRGSLTRARIGGQVEQSGRGQRVEPLDLPGVPSSPSSPGRALISAAGSGVGLLLAGMFFVLLEFLNRTVRRPSELVRALDITPLATIPYIETHRQRFLRRSMRVAVTLAVLVGLPALLWAVDQNVMPLNELAFQVMQRAGLS